MIIHGQALGSDIFIAFLYDNFLAEMRGHLILLHFLKAIFRPNVKFAGSLDFIAFLNDNFLALRRDEGGSDTPLCPRVCTHFLENKSKEIKVK